MYVISSSAVAKGNAELNDGWFYFVNWLIHILNSLRRR